MNDKMAVVQWRDKRIVSILSTLHSDTPVEIERRSRHAPGGCEVVQKPEAVVEYNRFMGGVDREDQFLSYYGFPHHTVKWWRRPFFFLFDTAIVNSYIIYCTSQTGRRLSHEQFCITLAKQLLRSSPAQETASHGPHHQPLQPLAQLTERHFPSQIEKSPVGHQLQQNCTVCSNKKERGRKTTTFKCKQCDLPMCVVPCFELYYTKVDPQRYL